MVSRVRVSKMFWEPNTTVKESVQRAASERTVMMLEDVIVRVRFSLFFFFLYWRSSREGNEKRGSDTECWCPYERQCHGYITLINRKALEHSGLSHRPCPPYSIPQSHQS